MFKYMLSFLVCCLILTTLSALTFSLVQPIFLAAIIIMAFNITAVYIWRMVVDSYDLEEKENRLMDSISVEKEKLIAVHEYRRLHEVDYAEFSDTVRATYLNKNPPANY